MTTKEKLYEAIADKTKQRAIDQLNLLIASANEYLSVLDHVTVKEFIERIKGDDLSHVTMGQILRGKNNFFFNCESNAKVTSEFTIDFIATKIRDNFLEEEVDAYINEIREWGDERERFYNTLTKLGKELHEQKLKVAQLERKSQKPGKKVNGKIKKAKKKVRSGKR